MEMWDVDTQRLDTAFSVPSSNGVVTAVASSSDGSLVASGSEDGPVAVYDTHTGDVVHSFKQDFSASLCETLPQSVSVSKSPRRAISLRTTWLDIDRARA